MKAAMQGSTVSCISLNTGRSESWVQLHGHQLLSAPSANLWAQAVGSWLDCCIPVSAPQSLLVSGSLHKHNKMTSFLAVPTSSSSQTTAMLKPTTKAAKRCCLQGWQKALWCGCWSVLTFTTFFPLVLLFLLNPEQPVPLEGDDMHNQVCGMCVPCPIAASLPRWIKRFQQFRVYTGCASATSHFPFSCIHSSNSQNPFSLLIQLSFLVYFSSPFPCKRWLHMKEAKGAQYMKVWNLENGLCNFPCLGCLNLRRTKHYNNFFWNKTLRLRESRTTICAAPVLSPGWVFCWSMVELSSPEPVCRGTHFSSSYRLEQLI